MKQIADSFILSDWVAENKNYLIAAALGLLLLTGILWKSFATDATETDYLTAANNFTVFKKAVANSKATNEDIFAALDKLDAQMKSFPEMREKYDGDIAQLLLARGLNERAIPFAHRLLKRSQPNVLATYTLFGNQTVEIASGNTEKAIELGQEVAKATSNDSLLHAFNTFQLALLEKSPQQWEAIKADMREKGFQKLNEIFALGNVNLINFIHSQTKP